MFAGRLRVAKPLIFRRVRAARRHLYERARQRTPSRWSGTTRNWTPIATVVLNPESEAEGIHTIG
jgi:hypothetical protein